MKSKQELYDFIIVGSGFGGSVCALRLVLKGYSVAVLEKGKDYSDGNFAKTNWQLKKYLWAPFLRCFGIQAITWLHRLLVLHGVGVGGGSLVYANILMRPKKFVFDLPAWPKMNWFETLQPYYERAEKMLGVVEYHRTDAGEIALQRIAERLGVSSTFTPTRVGIFFDDTGKQRDPYFENKGPLRSPCIYCGACMVGCRHNAKNTLDKNYLYFALKSGLQIFPETEVVRIEHINSQYLLKTKSSTKPWSKNKTWETKQVVLAAGVIGTLKLLLKARDHHKTLPQLSHKIGEGVRTNGESLVGATSLNVATDYSCGVAIGAAIYADDHTKIENVRYPSGSGLMRFLAFPHNWKNLLKFFLIRDWARSSVILLIMQSIDVSLDLCLGKRGLKIKRGDVPHSLPLAQKAAQILGEEIQGISQNVITESILGVPTTAHILGGCSMGTNKNQSVVNTNHEVFGYPGLFVCDGSIIPSNLGVNPSLTITALAERFTDLIPVKEKNP